MVLICVAILVCYLFKYGGWNTIHTCGKKCTFPSCSSLLFVLTKKTEQEIFGETVRTCEHACWFKLVKKQHLSPKFIMWKVVGERKCVWVCLSCIFSTSVPYLPPRSWCHAFLQHYLNMVSPKSEIYVFLTFKESSQQSHKAHTVTHKRYKLFKIKGSKKFVPLSPFKHNTLIVLSHIFLPPWRWFFFLPFKNKLLHQHHPPLHSDLLTDVTKITTNY